VRVQRSLLGNLAIRFHQDFDVEDISYEEAADEHVASLGHGERRELAAQLRALLGEYPGRKAQGLKSAWIRLGAGSLPRGSELRALLEHVLRRASAEPDR
jgi:hypothetical protein